MICSVWDTASQLTFHEAAEVDPILYVKALDSRSRWKVLHVQLRINPEGLIPCWDLHGRCLRLRGALTFLIFCGVLCSKLGCQVLCAALLKLCKYHHWVLSRIKKETHSLEPLRRTHCAMVNSISELLCTKRRGESKCFLQPLPSVWKSPSSLKKKSF